MLIPRRWLSAAAVICTAPLALLGAAFGAEAPTRAAPLAAPDAAHAVIVVGIQLATSGTTNVKLIEAERVANAEVTTAIEKELAKLSPRVERASASNCSARQCLPDLAARRGVDQAISVTGAPNGDEGYDLRAESWYRGAFRAVADRCEFCDGKRLVELATKMVRALVVTEIATAPPSSPPDAANSTSGATRDPAAALVVPAQPAPVHPSLLAPALLGATGLAALVAGISLWILDGREGSCHQPVTDGRFCLAYNTTRFGQVLTGVGAAGLAIGGVLLFQSRPGRDFAHLSVGPGSVVWSGRF